MTGLALKFENGKALIDLTRVRSGTDHELQTALINALTWEGSDKVYPTKGTMLQRDAARGYLVGFQTARHAANFAALQTLEFMKNTRTLELDDLRMEPVTFENQHLRIDFTGYSGDTEIKFSTVI